jgi:hypothetical protein
MFDSLPSSALAQFSRARSQLDSATVVFVMSGAMKVRIAAEASDLASWLRPQAVELPPAAPALSAAGAASAIEMLLQRREALPALLGEGWGQLRVQVEALLVEYLRGASLEIVAAELIRLFARHPAVMQGLRRAVASAPPAATRSGGLESFSSDADTGDELLLRGLALQARDAFADPGALHLNAWFGGGRRGELLVVGAPVELHVNLGPRRGEAEARRISEVGRSLAWGVDHVDVMVFCADARVEPRAHRLPIPPNAAKLATFTLTPTVPGKLRVAVVLLANYDEVERVELTAVVAAPEGQ